MGYSNFKLDGVSIKNPTDFQPEDYPLTNSNRVGNGDMVMELVAWKRKFNFGYAAIDSTDLDTILNLLKGSTKMFHRLDYIENNIPKWAIVYPGAIPRKLHRGHGAKWVWKDVNFSLIER